MCVCALAHPSLFLVRLYRYGTKPDTFDVPILYSTLLYSKWLDSSGISDSMEQNNVKLIDPRIVHGSRSVAKWEHQSERVWYHI